MTARSLRSSGSRTRTFRFRRAAALVAVPLAGLLVLSLNNVTLRSAVLPLAPDRETVGHAPSPPPSPPPSAQSREEATKSESQSACHGISRVVWPANPKAATNEKYVVFYPLYGMGNVLISYVSSVMYACLTGRILKIAPYNQRQTEVFNCPEYFDAHAEGSLCRDLEMDANLTARYEASHVAIKSPEAWELAHCPQNKQHLEYFLCDDGSADDEFIAVSSCHFWGDWLLDNPHFKTHLSSSSFRSVLRHTIAPSLKVQQKMVQDGPHHVCIHVRWYMSKTTNTLGRGWLDHLKTCVTHLFQRPNDGPPAKREVLLFTMHNDVRRAIQQSLDSENGAGGERFAVRFASETVPWGGGGHSNDPYQGIADMFSMGTQCVHLLPSLKISTYFLIAANLMENVSVFPGEQWKDGCLPGSELTDLHPVTDYWNGGNDVCNLRDTTCRLHNGSNIIDVKPVLRFFENQKSTPTTTRVAQATGTLNGSNALSKECDAFHSAVEIGTSNFDTIIQQMARTDPHATGLSADAMQLYINQLPNLTCWKKLATAVVGNTDDIPPGAIIETYFIDPDHIAQYNLPTWLRGCNSVGRPHATALEELKTRSLLHLMQNISVPVVSVQQLLDNNGICRMKYFKVDVEGFDGDLLVAFAKWVAEKNWTCYADMVSGEFNELSNGRVGGDEANLALMKVGYEETGRKDFDRVWKYVGKAPADIEISRPTLDSVVPHTNESAHKIENSGPPATVVTAYFKIPSKHSHAEYNQWMKNMLSLHDPMVIYTSPDMVPTMKRLRSHASERTVVVPIKLHEMRMPTQYGIQFWRKQHDMDPEKAIHKHYYLYWIWNEKLEFLRRTIEENPFKSNFFAWVDIGYFRTTEYNHRVMLQQIPTALRQDQILALDVRSVSKDFMGAGFVGGYSAGLLRFHSIFYALLEANKNKFIGKEQDWFKKACTENEGLCALVKPDLNHGDPWFFMAPYMMGMIKS